MLPPRAYARSQGQIGKGPTVLRAKGRSGQADRLASYPNRAMTEPRSQTTPKKAVFAKPPKHWDDMTDEEQEAWAAAFVARIKESAKVPLAD